LSSKVLWALGIYRAENKRCSMMQMLMRSDRIAGLAPSDIKALKDILFRLQRFKWLIERISLAEWYAEVGLGQTQYAKNYLKLVRNFEHNNPDAEWGAFLTYIESLKESSIKATEPLIEDTNIDAVQLMTIHQAKGLEFDSVFLPDLNYLPRSTYPFLIVDKKFDVGLKVQVGPNNWEEDAKYKEIKGAEQRAAIEESKRLFYVAVTRAKHHLVLSSGASKARKNSWASYLEKYAVPLSPYWERKDLR